MIRPRIEREQRQLFVDSGGKQSARSTLALTAHILLLCVLCHPGGALGAGAWRLTSESQGVRIDHRTTADARRPQIRAELVFDAPPELVHQVITDYEHFAHFVPGVAQSRVIRRAGDVCWVHQRLKFAPPVADREYVLQITDRLHPTPGAYAAIDWTSVAPAAVGVQESDAVAPIHFSGYWVLRPARGGEATAAVYGVRFDAGGARGG